ncbi:glycosyltransferase [Microbacterium dextranolyticum]|uniref:D-inositol 3-phosphate glycosyltransferase n=1 Tax=Microbacterium dextranolyticum TaxID=36806 RepID=A0A9W6HKB2_9MICO|nr:glycosyltransferase [Microbacterium dextranolyticum]MBM7462080.1 glycosyltransferase involved in cell wall biosynthesis [Microbacterium dextranolyticum]GLJ94324.1 glycosyl transferase [Microbacterium dextranolyticum]
MSGLLVHEWIASSGGSENVLERFASIYPDADILCLWNDAHARFDSSRVSETTLSKTPLRRSKAAALPLMPLVWRARREGFDWALVSSHLFAHHVRMPSVDVPKLVYVHTPARYIWAPELDRRGDGSLARAVGDRFKSLDRRRAGEARSIAANSHFIADRTQEAWHRDAIVIYPPVNTEQITAIADWREMLGERERETLEALPQSFVLGASRLVDYKRLDLVVKAGESVDLPVVIAGSGPARAQLEEQSRQAKVPVTFVDSPTTPLLYALYQRATVFVFPPVEDFGIMPVEAMAAGTPVVVNAIGGAAESVNAPEAGAVFVSEDRHELRRAVLDASSIDPAAARARAELFSASRFDREVAAWVATNVKGGGTD